MGHLAAPRLLWGGGAHASVRAVIAVGTTVVVGGVIVVAWRGPVVMHVCTLIGVIFLAASNATVGFCERWARATLQLETWWSDDQGVFNGLLTRQGFYPVRAAGELGPSLENTKYKRVKSVLVIKVKLKDKRLKH